MTRDYNHVNVYHHKGYRIVLNVDTWEIYKGCYRPAIYTGFKNRHQAMKQINKETE